MKVILLEAMGTRLCLFKLSIVKDVGRNDLAALIDSSQEVAKKSLEKAAECVRCFEEDVAKARERAELQEFSLGSCPPNVGLQGMRWSTIGDQISDQSFDSRLRTVFDMVDKDADGRITEEEIKENNVTSSAKTIAGSTPLKQNQRHESSARIIRSILSNKEMRQSQSTRPQSEQAVPTSDLQKERQPLRPVHVQLILM
ncbi:hypothetical protein HN51_044623 [Arachis hypogaea]